MEAPSELERFLRDHHSEGTAVDEGVFTLSKEMALKKLSAFSLPFHSAWILKVVQAATVQPGEDGIVVRLSSRSIEIEFPVENWNYHRIEEVFYDPDPSGDAGLDHLSVALRVLGLQFSWPFAILLPFEYERLVWDEERFEKVPHETGTSGNFLLEILPRDGRELSGLLGWIAAGTKAGRTNMELFSTLLTWAYMCPKALTVDGVRLDAIQNVGKRSAKLISYPLTIGTPASDLPSLSLPSGTLSGQLVARSSRAAFGTNSTPDPTTRELSRVAMGGRDLQWNTPTPFLMSANYRLHTSSNKKEKEHWVSALSHSRVYWVRDGVVVDQELLITQQNIVTIDLFLSAEGLDSDLSTFTLRESPERTERLERAVQIVLSELEDLTALEQSLSRFIEQGRQSGRWTGFSILGLGAASGFVVPVFGLFIGAVGFWKLLFAGAVHEGKVDSLMTQIETLVRLLQERSDQTLIDSSSRPRKLGSSESGR